MSPNLLNYPAHPVHSTQHKRRVMTLVALTTLYILTSSPILLVTTTIMLIFISAYVLLALASWSALAAPLSGSGPDNGNAQKRSLSSPVLMGRQQPPAPGFSNGPGPALDLIPTSDGGPSSPSSTMDCEDKSKHHDHDKNNDNQDSPTTVNQIQSQTAVTPGLGPAIARRRFRSPMRRDNKPSIFERDNAPTTGAPSNSITVSDVINYYLGQKAAARKRAQSPRTSRDFN
ncbi:hypothetical protein F5888DRAFT_1804747 [Russula emetica]|nr:hypothetical protein F5888DRAFT_1804747 [Russula emetica]